MLLPSDRRQTSDSRVVLFKRQQWRASTREITFSVLPFLVATSRGGLGLVTVTCRPVEQLHKQVQRMHWISLCECTQPSCSLYTQAFPHCSMPTRQREHDPSSWTEPVLMFAQLLMQTRIIGLSAWRSRVFGAMAEMSIAKRLLTTCHVSFHKSWSNQRVSSKAGVTLPSVPH